MAMKRAFTQFLVFSLFSLNFSALAQVNGSDKQVLALHREALTLFNSPKPTRQTDRLALSKLLRVTSATELSRKNAPIFFDCYEKAGIIKQTYGAQRQAITLYKKAIACRFTYDLPDSLLFKPYLYCGSAYYFSSLFDSSLYYLKKAEAILLKFPAEQEAQRLYNSFGALYYESGNYQQSINYFRKAVQLNIHNKQSDKRTSLYSYKSNIASAERKMEHYDAAVSIYKSLIPLGINQNIVFINLGTIYLEKSQPDSALYYLTKVNNADNYNPVILENALGNAHIRKQNLTVAFLHLNKSLALHNKSQTTGGSFQKTPTLGITYKLLADAQQQQHKLVSALRNYQQSIIQLDYAFNNPDIYHNPPTVTGGFRNYALFESLAAKATCLVKFYKEQPTGRNRNAVIDTYKTALRLADYIEKSFDLEDAQLFTVRKVFPVYQEAVTFMLHAFEQTKDKAYLEEAFRWAEKSKAIALYINLKEKEIKSFGTIPDSLLRKERELKINLSRLLIKIDKATSENQKVTLTSAMQDNELALSRLANKLLDYPEYRRQKFSVDSVDVPYLRKKILRRNRTVVSYFQSNSYVHCFILTQDDIHYFKRQRDNLYQQALKNINGQLRTLVPGLAYQGHKDAKLLYDKLLRPAEVYLKNTTSLVIIPHNELGLLSFDVLESKDDTYLLERFDITYQYAASFLRHEDNKPININRTLSMAPFDSVKDKNITEFSQLPASDEEIKGLKGIQLHYRQATKENFLKLSNDASGIHLATHAVANSDDPSRSYIAFYTDKASEGKLYAHELRNAPLANVQLTFLSACETASGKVLSGEGVMSLSRAFSVAGCSNIVTSLWKAEDNATAYISIKFYDYVSQGYPPSQALQKAKLDLLLDGQYAQFHSPQYWSHLVFIGVPNDSKSHVSIYIWIACMLAVSLLIIRWRYSKVRISRRK